MYLAVELPGHVIIKFFFFNVDLLFVKFIEVTIRLI